MEQDEPNTPDAEFRVPARPNEDAEVCSVSPQIQSRSRPARRLDRHGAVLVQGPPGTGKTHTIANLIGHLLAQGKAILVTSHTTKALRVLHDQIVPELQPLCVPVLGADMENRAHLERAVHGITSRLSDDGDQLASQADDFARQRADLLVRLEAERAALHSATSDEYRDLEVAGESIAPSEAARRVRSRAEAHSWIPGPLEPGSPLPLSVAEVRGCTDQCSGHSCR